jgi:exodeoxyribonuclease VII small subunit
MKKEKITYEEAMAEIERIIERMEANNVNIDNLSVDLSRATKLIELCREKLNKTEADVDKILNNVKNNK